MARFGQLDTQYFDASGDPLSGGKIYFFESGTTTPKTTYADINNSIPNTHPVILDAAGRQPNIFFDGVAKATLTNSSDVAIVTRDPVGETATNFGDEWVSTRIYSANDVVIASDGQYYRSLLSANQNNNPVNTSGYWTLLYSVEWNSGITYGVSAVVTYDNQQYQSLQASNTNRQPDLSPTWWVPLNFAWDATATYADNQNVVGTDGVLYTSQQASNLNNDPTDPANRPTWWVGTSADAAASAAAAATSEANAATSETNAAISASSASSSATASLTSANNSANSATASATSASNAATSATSAASSASAASTSASNAATSETNAGNSATAAATSASNAATSETNAGNSATAAATSETNAANSATAAATSETNAANSATAASTSATNAATSETNASNSATAAATSATNSANSATASASSAANAATAEAGAEAALDEFTDIYLGAFANDPTTDNDGDPLAAGMLYYNTTADVLRVYSGTAWQDAGSAVNGTSNRATYTATSGQTTFAIVYDIGFVDVYLNGVKLIAGTDYTATNGTSIVLTTGAALNDLVDIVAFGTFSIANALTVSDLGVTVQGYDANTTTATNTQTLTNKTIRSTVYALTGTAFDATNGAIQTKTITANTTFTDSLSSGDAIVLILTDAGSYTITWPTMTWVTSGGIVAPTLTAADTLVFWKVSSTLYGAYVGNSI